MPEGNRAFGKRGQLSLQPLGDQSLELFGNRGHGLSCLVERSRDVEVGLGRRHYSGLTQHVQNVALCEVGVGSDAVEIPP